MNDTSPVRVSLIGAALSANKGAAAMVETVCARLPEVLGKCSFRLLTTFPDADSKLSVDGESLSVIGMQPMRVAFIEFPVALIAWFCRHIRLPLGWVRTRACRSMLESDVVVDVAGISFVDGRGLPITVYNALMTGIPLLLGVPTVKAAQALGPFATFPNRWIAPIILGHLDAICARGARTREHLDTLGLTNVHDVADLAFSLSEPAEIPVHVAQQIRAAGESFAVVTPSSVVRKLFESQGGDYVSAMSEVVLGIRSQTGLGVVLIPHSFQVDRGESRMNDGPVCRDIAARCATTDRVVLVDEDLSAGVLRKIISMGHVLVTSRFHAMISGLATSTPTVVIGWSHKYKEVLDDFTLADMAVDSRDLADPASIIHKIADAVQNHEAIVDKIKLSLPAVVERSERNFVVIADVVHPRVP